MSGIDKHDSPHGMRMRSSRRRRHRGRQGHRHRRRNRSGPTADARPQPRPPTTRALTRAQYMAQAGAPVLPLAEHAKRPHFKNGACGEL